MSEQREDALDDGGFGRVDASSAVDRLTVSVVLANHIIAEAQTSTRPALAHPAFETAPGLVGQILEEERVHRALQADVQFADLALGQGEQANTGKAQPLEQAGDVLLVARQTIERFGDDDIELPVARVFEEALIGPAQGAGAAQRAVGVGV
jgi:hypothetical protein